VRLGRDGRGAALVGTMLASCVSLPFSRADMPAAAS
jgi:hypothetical protein